jgi:predicted ATP-grasp superfamily ATP-dependent carboligase
MVKRRILLTDGDQRSTLACVRSLGKRGHECYVLGPGKGGGLAARSRYCVDAVEVPDPKHDPEGFVETFDACAASWGVDTLFPITEKTLRVILPRRAVYEADGRLLPFPDAAVFERVSDKAEVLRVAQEVGIEVPRQWVWRGPEDVDWTEVPDDTFPLAIKPSRSVPQGGKVAKAPPVRYVEDARGLAGWAQEAGPESFPALVQERIMGDGVGVFLLTWKGELRAAVGHRRIREKPPSGGVSTLRESTDPDPDLLDRSMQLLTAMGWQSGVAMVEYKTPRDSGIPVLMEVNGRFWGSLQLAINAGVDFPNLLMSAALEDETRSEFQGVVRGRPGVRTRWLLGDVDQLLLRILRSKEELSLPPGCPGRLGALVGFVLDFRPGTRLEVLRMTDIRPFLSEVSSWFKALR